MKTLTLMRHAKSGWDDLVPRDFDRPLNAKGKRAAETVGRHLRDEGPAFDLVVASPAVRVTETLEHLAMGLGRTLAPQSDKRLYLASPATLIEAIHGLPDTAASVLLMGHNPGIEELVLLMVPDRADDRLRDDVEIKFPTASVAELRFGADRWADVQPGQATLARFVRPRDLDPALGPDEGQASSVG